MNLSKLLKQTAVYWANPVPDGYGGYSFDDPVEIACRWEDKQEQFVGTDGQEVSKAVVYASIDFELGGYLLLGTLDDLDSTQNPEVEATAYKIRSIEKCPDTKGIRFLRKVWL